MRERIGRVLLSRPGGAVRQKGQFRAEPRSVPGNPTAALVRRVGVGVALLEAMGLAHGQGMQNMLAGAAAEADRARVAQSLQTQDYTFKEGDFRLLVTPSMGFEWNDNVNLAQTDSQDDFILTPAVGLIASYPLSQRNLLYLNVTVGYSWYLQHSRYSSFELNSTSGTGLSFDVSVKDVTFNIHDLINYTQGAGQYGAGGNLGSGSSLNTAAASVANTATYGTFQNTAGLSGTWDLNKVKLMLGYDHQNVLATSGQFDDISRSSEMVNFRASAQVHPQINTGLESTATFTTYEQQVLNNNNAYTVGPFLDFQPGAAFDISLRGGFETYQFDNSSQTIHTSSQDSWYAGLNMSHRPTDWVGYSVEIGREEQLGAVSDLLSDWYVRPRITWTVIKDLAIVTYLTYEHGNQGVGSTGSLPGYANGTFDLYGAGFTVQHPLTRWMTASLNYEFSDRSAAIPNESYTQNLVALQLSFRL